MAYVDLTARFVYELQTVFGDFNKLANNDAFMKNNGWQDGTVGVFYQAAAPTGWTKIVTADGRALRVVSGSGGGVSGTQDPATTITLAHTNGIATDADHTHAINSHSHHIATSGTDKAFVGATKTVGSAGEATLGSDQGFGLIMGGGTIFAINTKKNTLTLTGSYTSGAGGNHNHGGATASSLTNLSLAYVDVIFCSKDTSTGYTDLTLTFVHNTRQVFDYLQSLANNDAFNYDRRTPAGTVSIFSSATSPTGWTKVDTQNGKMLRLVAGTGGGSGGTTDPSTTITLAHTHTVSSDGAHTHSIPNHKHSLVNSSTDFSDTSPFVSVSGSQLVSYNGGVSTFISGVQDFTDTDGAGTSSSDGAHSHTPGSALSDITLAYVNVIQASKDSAGAPASYTDVTALFATYFYDQALLAYQEMQLLANNDAYLYYHTMPAAAVMFFFQSSAPLNWEKSTTHNDKILRIVSDTSGGTAGGSSPFSSSFLLAHTHTLDVQSHSHSYSHTHAMARGSSFEFQSNGLGVIANRRIYGANGADLYYAANTGAGDSPLSNATDSQSLATDSYSHSHGGATQSGLSNLTVAYADVIMCTKT